MTIAFPFRVFSVDPATGCSGWSVLDVHSLFPLKIQIVATGQIDGQKLLRTQKEMAQRYQAQFCILEALEFTYIGLLQLYGPLVVVTEGSFASAHPSAWKSLILAIHTLRKASKAVLDKDVVEVSPTFSKQCWTGSGAADKDLMRIAYQKHGLPDGFLSGVVADPLITEHEIDSISHGHAYIRMYLVKDRIQISAKEKRAQKKERLRVREEKKLEKAKSSK
jgi:Holliday junction resolvasome RuvABC endonuclease subunit